MQIDDWLHKNTFRHAEFCNILALVSEKEKQGVTISLCIPTLNEERTIGKEILLFKSELMDRYPLLDEIAVIDSGSEDKTREIAASFGAEVYLTKDILPEEGGQAAEGLQGAGQKPKGGTQNGKDETRKQEKEASSTANDENGLPQESQRRTRVVLFMPAGLHRVPIAIGLSVVRLRLAFCMQQLPEGLYIRPGR